MAKTSSDTPAPAPRLDYHDIRHDEWTIAQTIALYIAVFCATGVLLAILLYAAGFLLSALGIM